MEESSFTPDIKHFDVHTRSLEEARALYSSARVPTVLDMTSRAAFEWRANVRSFAGVRISSSRYGGGFVGHTETVVTSFAVNIPLGRSTGEGLPRGGSVPIVGGKTGLFTSPGQPLSVKIAGDFRAYEVSFEDGILESALRTLTGDDSRDPLRFGLSFSIAGGEGASFVRLVRFLFTELGREPGVIHAPLVAARAADTLLYSLLSFHAHSHREILRRDVTRAEPRALRLAEEYIVANVAEPIRLQDLARVSGVGARTLQSVFRAHRGHSPLDFVRSQRLELARARLTGAPPGTTVAEIALACGFEHLGRFSQDYRARFGEPPSTTLRR